MTLVRRDKGEIRIRFFVQFIRFRRGVPEAICTTPIDAEDCESALAQVTLRVGTGTWPMNTEALRVIDDGGRTVLQWMAPTAAEQEPAQASGAVPSSHAKREPLLAQQAAGSQRVAGTRLKDHARLEVGQAISYAEDNALETWKGGYQIVSAPDPIAGEGQFMIRSADEAHDRTVDEHELREDSRSRTQGQ